MPSITEVEGQPEVEEEEFSDCLDGIADSTANLKLEEPLADEKPVEVEQPVETTSGGKWHIDEIHLKEMEEFLDAQEIQDRQEKAQSLRQEGNDLFRSDEWEKAVNTYTEALQLCPLKETQDRAALYCNRAAAFMKLEMNDLAIEDCNKAIELNPKYEKAFMRRAQLYELKEETYDKALEDYKAILLLNSDNKTASTAIRRLPLMISERNERMKTEMFGKLKDLGNLILKPFGLSTENFKLEPNESGGYSMKMEK